MVSEHFDPDSLDNDTENRLLSIWSDVLHLDIIGADSSFFDLGGDSLSALLCINRIRATFGIECTIDDFFLPDATITRFAKAINQVRAGSFT